MEVDTRRQVRRDPRLILADKLLQIAHVKVAIRLAEDEGWKMYRETIERHRASHLEILATNMDCDVSFERGVIQTLSTLRAVNSANPALLAALEAEARGLQKTVEEMQDAGLFRNQVQENP